MYDYDHYIALDWAQRNMAVAKLSKKGKRISSYEGTANVGDLREYLKSLRGTKILTLEESTCAQWLYVELKDHVDKIIVCDPRRNKLLSEGAKTDKIDAVKLVKLLKASMLKEVYHSADQFIYLRRIVSGYADVVKAGVRVKNQKSALLRAAGVDGSTENELKSEAERFVLDGLNKSIEAYEREKKRYIEEISRLCKQHRIVKVLKSLPGIDEIGAIKIAARIVNPKRFPTKGHYLSFCGQIKHEKISGGTSYGKKKTNHSRELKNVFDMAATCCIGRGEDNYLRKRYLYLTLEKRLPDHVARRAIARHVSVLSWGVMKSGKPFDKNRNRRNRSGNLEQ